MNRSTHFKLGIVGLLIATLSMISCGSSDEPFTLVAAGDIAQCGIADPKDTPAYQTASLVDRILKQAGQNSAVLTLGDNVYYAGLATEYQNCYEPTWGKFKDKTWATPGNHDYGVANAVGYYNYFGDRAGTDRTGYYKQNLDDWTLLALNSNVGADAGSGQMGWVKAQRAGNSGCKIAAWHYPVFTSAARGDNKTMQAIWGELEAQKVDIILQGHEHQYERFAATQSDGAVHATNGIRSFVVGTGGASLSDFAAIKSNSEMRLKNHGVLVLKLYTSRYEWSFQAVNGATLDSGSGTCKS